MDTKFNIILASTVTELKGQPIHGIEEIVRPKKQIMVSRSFGKDVTELEDLRQALATHTARALEKLRKQKSVAEAITIFLQTNRFLEGNESYHHQNTLELLSPSQDTNDFLKLILKGLEIIYRKGMKYKKAGVIISGISPEATKQFDLFHKPDPKSILKMKLMDKINEIMGSGKIRFAVEGFQKRWQMRSIQRSLCYTTRWADLPIVKAN